MLRMSRNLVEFFRRDACRFGVAQQGVTAVEFALLAPAFFAVLLGIFQMSIFLYAQANLQAAASEGGRLFMTGQAQNASMTEANFLNQICPMIQTLFNCNNVMINVQSYSNFSSASASPPTLSYNAQGQVTNTWSYSPGTPGQVMVVQLIYQWPIIGGPLGNLLPNNANGSAEIMGVAAFRVEPY
jgi:Flp pilus assembly protein TadG